MGRLGNGPERVTAEGEIPLHLFADTPRPSPIPFPSPVARLDRLGRGGEDGAVAAAAGLVSGLVDQHAGDVRFGPERVDGLAIGRPFCTDRFHEEEDRVGRPTSEDTWQRREDEGGVAGLLARLAQGAGLRRLAGVGTALGEGPDIAVIIVLRATQQDIPRGIDKHATIGDRPTRLGCGARRWRP